MDLFVNLSKYKPTENVSPLENFTTELFVYILKDLLRQKNEAGYEILALFGIRKNESIQNISTQNEYKVDDRILRPDIEIDLDNRVVFVEVKVNSPLHPSILKGHLDDQLEDYQQIQVTSGKAVVYSLTKLKIYSRVKTNVRWYSISKILKKLEGPNQIIDNFISFLEINNMSEQKAMKADTAHLMTTYFSFFDYLREIFEASKFAQNSKYRYGTNYVEKNGLGFFIMDKNKRKSKNEEDGFYFLGILPPYENEISFQVLSDYLKDKKWKKDWLKDDEGVHPIIKKINISKITNEEDSDKQIENGVKWLNEIYDSLQLIIKKAYI